MRLLTIIGIFCLLQSSIYAQKTTRFDANQMNGYGVNYSLPLTALELTIKYEVTKKQRGPYYQYAGRYLNLNDVPTENSVNYKLLDITATTIGIPDESNKYFVEFKPNTIASFITLTKDGLICAINDEYTFPITSDPQDTTTYQSLTVKDGNKYLTQDILMAGTTAKQAELIAQQIYNLRQNRNDVLSGEMDNIPTDGQAFKSFMSRIDDQENALTALFKGEESKQVIYKKVIVDITSRNMDNKVIARFSPLLGVVSADNLAGAPIYLTIKAQTAEDTSLTGDPKLIDAFEKKLAKGIVYNVPAKASLDISFDKQNYVNKEIDVVQFGIKDVLEQRVFGTRTGSMKVIFYPELGAIKSTALIP